MVSFGPSIGGETQKTRLGVVLSNDTSNALLNRVQVIPISSQMARVYPAEIALTLNGRLRKAMADQISAVSKVRLRRRLGVLEHPDLLEIARVLRRQLELG